MSLELDRRRTLLVAALGFLQLPPRAPELRLLHQWLDTWTGLDRSAVRGKDAVPACG
jgi:hypothetical protein